jgi:hypothetical protein
MFVAGQVDDVDDAHRLDSLTACSTISEPAKRSSSPSTARRDGGAVRATHPSRTTALVVREGSADTSGIADREEVIAAIAAMWGTGEWQHVLNPDSHGKRRSGRRSLEWNAWRRAQAPSRS